MKPYTPRVSVGLPLYNAERYLKEALDSILSQTFSDFTLILSDNCSTDKTQEICQCYAEQDARILYFRQERNVGAAPNFNKVFELSSSEYFKWAPYDDLLEPEFLSRCVSILDDRPDVVLCYSRVKIIDENSKYVVDYNPGPNTNYLVPHQRFQKLMLHPEYAVQQMGLIRSAELRKTGLHRSFPSSDEILLAELSLLGSYYEIPDRLYLYRRHAEQSTKGSQRSRIYFFDTKLIGKILLPTWMYFGAALKVVANQPQSLPGKLHCYMTMFRWFLIPDHFRAMGKDVLLAFNQWINKVRGSFTRKRQRADGA